MTGSARRAPASRRHRSDQRPDDDRPRRDPGRHGLTLIWRDPTLPARSAKKEQGPPRARQLPSRPRRYVDEWTPHDEHHQVHPAELHRHVSIPRPDHALAPFLPEPSEDAVAHLLGDYPRPRRRRGSARPDQSRPPAARRTTPGPPRPRMPDGSSFSTRFVRTWMNLSGSAKISGRCRRPPSRWIQPTRTRAQRDQRRDRRRHPQRQKLAVTDGR